MQKAIDLERFRAIQDYYEERSRDRGDIYGWGVVQVEPTPVARLVVDPTASDIPSMIDGIVILRTAVDEPEALS